METPATDVLAAYEDDILTWAEQQAAALRRLAGSPGLPNELDLEHIAEEIEDVGKSELHAVESLVIAILVHLIKGASSTNRLVIPHWRVEAANFQSNLVIRYERSMRRRIRMDTLWRRAVAEAETTLAAHAEAILPGLPDLCPLGIDDLVREDWAFDDWIARILAADRARQT